MAYYSSAPHRRWLVLLSASVLFYATSWPLYALVLAASVLVDYGAARAIHASAEGRRRRQLLALAVGGNLSILFVFKYFDWASRSLGELCGWSAEQCPQLGLLLPVGVSFYTFQSLSYTIDVFRRRVEPERSLARFALFVTFFPQLVAGPIERARSLLPQLRMGQRFDAEAATQGLVRVGWGAFKKLVIADRLALVVDRVYGDVGAHSGTTLAVTTILFGYQIYCDFSGYTDIAIGSARILGIDLMENFRHPYAARSVAGFWQRWHISLSSWFQDYVFTPLYLRWSRWRWLRRLPPSGRHLVVFAASLIVGLSLWGLWHGAALTFVLFGVHQALGILSYHVLRRAWDRWPRALQVAATLTIVMAGWVWFRASSVGEALSIYGSMLRGGALALPATDVEHGGVNLPVALCGVALVELVQWARRRQVPWAVTLPRPLVVRWSLYTALVLGVLAFGGGGGEFIYFRF